MNRQWLYAKQPQGKIGKDTFEWRETAIPEPREGEALVRTRLLSLDPANRAWMMGKTYRDALQPGEVMSGFVLGEVVESNALGFDAAVDYKAGGVFRALRAACPNGIDVYFDNTGGPVLDAALGLMNLKGRIACCGNVSQYDVEKPAPGPMAVPGLIVTKRIRMEGFIVMDFYDRRAEAEARLVRWISEGRIKAEVDIIDGLERAPEALIGLFEGTNRGKRAVRV